MLFLCCRRESATCSLVSRSIPTAELTVLQNDGSNTTTVWIAIVVATTCWKALPYSCSYAIPSASPSLPCGFLQRIGLGCMGCILHLLFVNSIEWMAPSLSKRCRGVSKPRNLRVSDTPHRLSITISRRWICAFQGTATEAHFTSWSVIIGRRSSTTIL